MRGMENLLLGYTAMKTSFTQIYDKTADLANQISSNNKPVENIFMPEICSAKDTLKDIYNKTSDTEILKWIYNQANTTND
jgi:thymidylate synthase